MTEKNKKSPIESLFEAGLLVTKTGEYYSGKRSGTDPLKIGCEEVVKLLPAFCAGEIGGRSSFEEDCRTS